MRKLYDVTVPTHPKLPVWPGGPLFTQTQTHQIADGEVANVTDITMCVHTGTHIDAPLHFVDGAIPTSELSLEQLVGDCVVADLRGKRQITAADLDQLDLPSDARKLLVRTDNSELWNDLNHAFCESYCAFTTDGAEWLRDHGIQLVGVDYLSVSLFSEPPEIVHRILLGAGIVCLEGLNLIDVEPGNYRLICLPMKIVGSDGAPARVLLEAEQ